MLHGLKSTLYSLCFLYELIDDDVQQDALVSYTVLCNFVE